MVAERSLMDRFITITLYLLATMAAMVTVLPFLHVVAVSLSSRSAISAYIVGLWPVGLTLDNYRWIVQNPQFFSSLGISVARVIVGVLAILIVGVLTAYPLSREDIHLPGRTAFKMVLLFAMLFNGGLIPFYLSMRSLGLLNNFLVLILPGALNIFYVILLINFFRGIPQELRDAAAIDGASHFDLLVRIYLPISLPVLATVALFSTVTHWNSWFDAILYINRSELWPLQSYLYSWIATGTVQWTTGWSEQFRDITPEGLTMTFIVVAAAPVALVYPFLQRYFVHGLTLGASKG